MEELAGEGRGQPLATWACSLGAVSQGSKVALEDLVWEPNNPQSISRQTQGQPVLERLRPRPRRQLKELHLKQPHIQKGTHQPHH